MLVEEDPKNDNQKEEGTDPNVHISTALNLEWSFGINRHVPVLNLSDGDRKGIFYTTTHTGIYYNFETNSQILYQGHCNSISCTCISSDKRWLATADIGQDCIVIIWDTKTSVPIRTIFDVDPVGVKAMSFSSDAKFVAVLSSTVPQVLTIWDWTTLNEYPCASINFDENLGLQNYVCFNVNDTYQLVCNNKKSIIFCKWSTDGDILVNAPKLTDEDFNKTVGNYNQSVFHPSYPSAFTSTSCGNIVVWTMNLDNSSTFDVKALKIVKIQEKAISVLHLFNDYIVTGDVAGTVKFLDLDLRLLNWFNKFGVKGTINSISFSSGVIEDDTSEDKSSGDKSNDKNGPISATLESEPFLVNDFSLSTTKATMLYFNAKKSKIEFLSKQHDNDVKAISCHPTESYIVIGGYDGFLQLLDFESKRLKHSKQYSDKRQITSTAYSPSGDFLAVGFSDGQVEVLDSLTLEMDPGASFHFSHESIEKLVFSHDSSILACYDKDRCVVVFKLIFENKSSKWEYLGKHRAHYKQITDLMFIKALDVNTPRLMSIGEDRMLVEYDMKNSAVDDLRVVSSDRIEQDALPMCFAAYPPVVKEDFIAVANNQFKIKLFNSTTKMCRHTYLGPTYGSPLKQLKSLPIIPDAPNRYMAYITKDKVGLMILPLNGNPHNSMALIAHPGEVHNVECSFDGKYVFTSGGEDTAVLMWKVDVDSLQATAALGGEGLIPFYSLLEGGRDGDLFAELETYFYYAQIRNQGVDSLEKRDISTEIPLSEIHFIMRALGYYPTEQEIDEMLNEIKFSEYVDTGKCLDSIDIGGLLKLYVNHRPAFGVNPDELIEAFKKIGYSDITDDEIKVDRMDFLTMLQEKGEHLNENELGDCITLLLEGEEPEGLDDEEDEVPMVPLDEALPDKLTLDFFTNDLLGFGSLEEIIAEY